MPMQSDWVDAIFARLTIAYGQRFLQQWNGLEPADVKAHWATELDGITSRGVAHALKVLPAEHPPNAMQFRAMCTGAPVVSQVQKQLPAPRASDATVARAVAAAGRIRAQRDPHAWARDLRKREHQGEHLTPMQQRAWRTALGSSHDRTGQDATTPGEVLASAESL